MTSSPFLQEVFPVNKVNFDDHFFHFNDKYDHEETLVQNYIDIAKHWNESNNSEITDNLQYEIDPTLFEYDLNSFSETNFYLLKFQPLKEKIRILPEGKDLEVRQDLQDQELRNLVTLVKLYRTIDRLVDVDVWFNFPIGSFRTSSINQIVMADYMYYLVFLKSNNFDPRLVTPQISFPLHLSLMYPDKQFILVI